MNDDSQQRNTGSGPPLPERFGAYRVEGLIGSGGMGIVYRALDEALQRPVALKTLLPAMAADPEFVARFKREAQSAAALNHPNITQIYAIGQEGTIPYFAMELIQGRSLEDLVKDAGPIEPGEAASYIIQAARGLRHAAERKLIHRDVKPSNLMLTEDGEVKITDFGLAKAARGDSRLTTTGEVIGSPGYISPEQAQGSPLDARSDIYSLGATFYQLVTGKLPFDAPTPVAMIIKHLNEPLKSPRAHNPAIPYPIAASIQKMMAKRPGERFQDYDALIRDLERALSASQSVSAAQIAAATAAASTPGAGAASRPAPSGAESRSARLRAAAARTVADAAPAAGEPRRRGSWLPLVLAGALGSMAVAGVVHHLRTGDGGGPGAPPTAAARDGAPLEIQGTFTSRPAATGRDLPPGRAIPTLDERLRERLIQRNKADLAFVTHDHEVLPDGRLRVFGQVRNNGGSAASQARARIRVILDNGTIAAQGETPLAPSTVQPTGTASFEIVLDYAGPIASIRAELVWYQ
jgi:predicted Ser/Thr protein kinase